MESEGEVHFPRPEYRVMEYRTDGCSHLWEAGVGGGSKHELRGRERRPGKETHKCFKDLFQAKAGARQGWGVLWESRVTSTVGSPLTDSNHLSDIKRF